MGSTTNPFASLLSKLQQASVLEWYQEKAADIIREEAENDCTRELGRLLKSLQWTGAHMDLHAWQELVQMFRSKSKAWHLSHSALAVTAGMQPTPNTSGVVAALQLALGCREMGGGES